jgi:aminopeptidase N
MPQKRFHGIETIVFSSVCDPEVRQIELHADESLRINSVRQNEANIAFNHTGCVLSVESADFPASPIIIDYDGSLCDQCIGFFYVNDYSCATQFEPNYARRAFPCFDEPCVKSTYSISLEIPVALSALSNLPCSAVQEISSSSKIVKFETTPEMCSYLVAFSVGIYDSLSGTTPRGLPICIYVSKNARANLHFALSEAIKAVDWLERYYGMNFDLPQLQILGCPKFMNGGMENYGLIIMAEVFFTSIIPDAAYTDTGVSATEMFIVSGVCDPSVMELSIPMLHGKSLLELSWGADEMIMSLFTQMLTQKGCRSITAQVITHEIVHMWAGDMVSPKWWDSLWLNEGFATLMPTLMFAEYHQNFEFLSLHDAALNQVALCLDAMEKSRPVHGGIVAECDPFDLLSYNKAGMVLGMLRRMVGSWRFQEAVRTYMKKWYRKSLDTSDLLQSLNESLGMDLSQFFDAWIYNSGFPLIVVEDDTIRQMPFCDAGTLWPIPLRIRYANSTGRVETVDVVLTGEVMELPVKADWIIVNPGCESFCRVWLVGNWFYSAVSAVARGVLTQTELLHFRTELQILYRRGFVSREEMVYANTCLGMAVPS